MGIERCGKINAMNSGPESCTGIGVGRGFLSYWSSGNSFARSMSGPRRKVQLWPIIQGGRETSKLATTYLRGSYRVSVDATCLDPGAPTSLDRVINSDHHRAGGQQPSQHVPQQPLRHRPRIPAGSVQYFMIAAKTRIISQ